MKRPIKRPMTLRPGHLYQLKDGRKGIFHRDYHVIGNTAWFRIPYRKTKFFGVRNWPKEVIKRLRRKTDSE